MSYEEEDDQTHVRVGYHRYKIKGAQQMAFENQLSAIVLEGSPDLRDRSIGDRDAFLVELPDWALYDIVEAADALAARARQLLEINGAD